MNTGQDTEEEQAAPGHGGLVWNVISPELVPSPTFSWQANLYDSGFCSICRMCQKSSHAISSDTLLPP